MAVFSGIALAVTAVAGAVGAVGTAAAGLIIGTTAAAGLATGTTLLIGGAVIGAAVGGIVSAVKGESIWGGILKGGLIGAAAGGALGWANTWAAGHLAQGAQTAALAESAATGIPMEVGGVALGGAPGGSVGAASVLGEGTAATAAAVSKHAGAAGIVQTGGGAAGTGVVQKAGMGSLEKILVGKTLLEGVGGYLETKDEQEQKEKDREAEKEAKVIEIAKTAPGMRGSVSREVGYMPVGAAGEGGRYGDPTAYDLSAYGLDYNQDINSRVSAIAPTQSNPNERSTDNPYQVAGTSKQIAPAKQVQPTQVTKAVA